MDSKNTFGGSQSFLTAEELWGRKQIIWSIGSPLEAQLTFEEW